MASLAPGATLLLISDDLLFPSRVREALRATETRLAVAATADAAQQALLVSPPPVAVLVNLTARRYDPDTVIRALKAAAPSLPVFAFAGHVEKAKHEAARAAGADRVLANSSVSLHLATLLPRLLSGAPEEDTDGEAE